MYAIQLGYDNVGSIAQKIETVSGSAHTFDYTYDLDGQLFEVRKDGILVEEYGYDNNANRTSTLGTTCSGFGPLVGPSLLRAEPLPQLPRWAILRYIIREGEQAGA